MQYRLLGSTGLKISQLGFGCMRLPMTADGPDAKVDREKAAAMLMHAYENGVNYFDTAVGYCNSDSQCAVGEILKPVRDKVVLSTKNPYYGDDEKAWWKNLEDSLERLQTDYIDVYHHHGVNASRWEEVEKHVGKWMTAAKDQGLVRHVAFSYHDNAEKLIELIDLDYTEVITLQYNMLNRDLAGAIDHAASKGVGIVVMGPVGGGRLGVRSEVLETMIDGVSDVPELALRFVLANQNVSVALSGMSDLSHVEQNLEVAANKVALSDAQKQAIDSHCTRLRDLADLYCTGCGYCMPCPQSVGISRIFEMYNTGKVYGLWDAAKDLYSKIGSSPWDKATNAAECVDCGACEPKCPQNIPIRQQLRQCHEILTQ